MSEGDRGVGAPLVMGGSSGSGTRVLAGLARAAGFYIGTELSPALDARAFLEFGSRWIDHSLDAWINDRRPANEQAMEADFADFVARHRAGIDDPARPWAFKEPRALAFLPLIARVYPESRFVHIVRDGRDVAFKAFGRPEQGGGGRERWQSWMPAGQSVLVDRSLAEGPATPLKMALWARYNELIADYGESTLGARYMRVRLEDVCARPEEQGRELLRFMLGDEPAPTLVSATAQQVTPSQSLGHWRRQDPGELQEVVALGGGALERFGYGP
jgi:Sulfotransferase family